MTAPTLIRTVTTVERLSCATCKWATYPRRTSDYGIDRGDITMDAAGFPLRCDRATMVEIPSLAKGLAMAMDATQCRAELYVKPDFGCVQWEAK